MVPETPSKFTAFDSPRTKEACDRLGLLLGELRFKSKEKFAEDNPAYSAEVADMRWKALEENRKKKLRLVIEERKKIEPGSIGGKTSPSGPFASMGFSARSAHTPRSMLGAKSSSITTGLLKGSPTESGVFINKAVLEEALSTAAQSAALLREKREIEKLRIQQERELEEFKRKELEREE